jgi:hypothetical protein
METGNHKTYYLSDLALTWIEGFFTCRSFGTELWYFESREEWDSMNQIVRDHESLFGINGISVGAMKIGKDEWYWSHSGKSVKPNTFEWNEGEPNNFGGIEQCSEFIFRDNRIIMNDIRCRNNVNKFVCVDVVHRLT